MVIDCDECRMHHTEACADCVVTFVVGREPDDALVIDVEEARAIRRLAQVGLVPGLRHSVAGQSRASARNAATVQRSLGR